MPNWTASYVDDLNAGEQIPLSRATRTITTKKEEKDLRAHGCENLLKSVTAAAADMGMKVNGKKTGLICITSALHSSVNSHIKIDGKRVEGQETMKVLGFMFGRRPGVEAHVQYIEEKVRKNLWTLIHLKRPS